MGCGYCVALDYQGNVVACVLINGSNYNFIEDTLRNWYHHEVFKTDKPLAVGSHWEEGE